MSERPNVLLICTDHWASAYTRCMGHPVVMTPTIDALARSGVYYNNAYSACPTCVPARRALMLGQTSRTHGDRSFTEEMRMPDPRQHPTLAQCFSDAGYQAYAVGKLHVNPQRNRIGFDDVLLNEEGRHQFGGLADDWELFLQDRGFAGQEYAAGHNNNDIIARAWHLPEHCHPTNWAAREMCRTIHRRDRDRPAFWYLSFVGPHPPIWPLQAYMDIYRDLPMDEPVVGDWARDKNALPWMLRQRNERMSAYYAPLHEIQIARRAFYACITHIDHQIRTVVGILREQRLLDNTIIAFTADHGDMLGDHGIWTKSYMYDLSAKIPLLISLPHRDERLPRGTQDNRLVEIRDIMPTLLDACGIDIPASVEGMSLMRDTKREHLYGEHFENTMATRMVRDARYKLIYYPAGNITQLFDMANDPRETRNLADDPAHAAPRKRLTELLLKELYGSDLEWLKEGRLVGIETPPPKAPDLRRLMGQRGYRFM